jgi:O-antigen/teichoic acid export membrane protein
MLQRLARNTFIGLLGTLALRVSAFATTLVLARGLGQDDFGIYAFVGVFIFFFSFLTDLGIERVLTRELSRQPEHAAALVGNALLLRLALCCVAVPAAVGLALAMGFAPEVRYCVLLAALGLPLSVDSIFRAFFQSRFQIDVIYRVSLPMSVFFLLLIGVCVSMQWPVRAVFYAALLNAVATLGLFLALTLPHIRPDFRPQRDLIWLLLRDAGQMGAFSLMFMLAMRIDQFMLFQMRGAEEVAFYAAAVRITEALSIVPEALMLTVLPILASSQRTAPERFRETYRLSFKYLTALILPVALILTVAREQTMRLIFGAAYVDGSAALAILAWSMYFAYNGAVYLNLVFVQALHRLMLIVSALALACNVALNLALIPTHGAAGAAAATAASAGFGYLFWTFHPETRSFMAVCWRESLRPLASLALASLVIFLTGAAGGWGAIAGIAVYSIALVASGGLNRADLDVLRRHFASER